MVLQWFSCDPKYLRAITPKRHLIILTLWNVGSSRYSEHLFHSKFILPIMVFNIYDNNLYFQLMYFFQLWHPFKWIISNTIYYLSAFQKEFSVLYIYGNFTKIYREISKLLHVEIYQYKQQGVHTIKTCHHSGHRFAF